VPSYSTFMANERFAVASNELYNAYRFARNEAIKTSSSMTLEATTVDDVWANGWQVTNSSNDVLLVSKIPHLSVVISGAAVTVKGMGSLSGSMQTFTITGADDTNCISILASGQSQVKSGSCP
jgi:type IV fimbrial biogenesis protein FimT